MLLTVLHDVFIWSCLMFVISECIWSLQCSALMDQSSNREDYTEDIKEEYEDIRVDHYDTLRVSIRVDYCW